ncbi:MAG: tetratricopeptide repeat protein [Sedimentisphaerales bacterium]
MEQSSNQNEEAIVLLERAVKIDPELKNTQIALATTLYQTGEAERAVSMYKELLEQYPNDVQILNNLAWILQEHDQRYDEALELVNRGLALSQNDIYLLDTRGNILANMNNRLADARDDYERLVELTPANSPPRVSALLGLGRVYAKLKELDQAQHYLQDALEINRQIEVLTQEEISEIQNILDSSAANRTNP